MKSFFVSCLFLFSQVAAVESNSTQCWGTCDEPGFYWEEATCSCINDGKESTNEPCNIRCASGYTLEYLNGKCYCAKIECESWQMVDEEQRKCVCKSSWGCDSGYVWDDYSCNCLPVKPSCDLICEDPQALDELTCECIDALCFKLCPSGYLLDTSTCSPCSECECKPDPSYSSPPSCTITCRQGFSPNFEQCQCECNIKSCPDGQNLEADLCQCLGCDKKCPEGFIISQSNSDCECVPDSSAPPTPSSCDPRVVKCGNGTDFDPILCECVKNAQPVCPSGYTYDMVACACKCSNIEECRENFLWSESTCSCICPLGQVCEIGFVFNPNVCSCVCEKNITCGKGFFLNEDTCSCACIETEACALGYIWDESTCKCVKDREPMCGPGLIYDHDRCECVCEVNLLCENQQVFDSQVCQCVCPKNVDCRGGFLNVDSCKCENAASW